MFAPLADLARRQYDQCAVIYPLLRGINAQSSASDGQIIAEALAKMPFSSNTNGVFHFFFPLVAHLLYYQPQWTSLLMPLIVGPNFANGDSDRQTIIGVMIGAMHYKLIDNQNYISPEGRIWVEQRLPYLQPEVQNAIDQCQRELDEI